MPQYLIRKDNTYYFRQGVPQELRAILGKREIKRSLGRDYAKAVRECKRVAVEADSRLADARARFDSIPIDPYSQDGIRRTRHIVLTTVTAELETQFGSLMRGALLETDHEKRIVGFDGETFREYGQHIQDALTALRRQLAMGDVSSLVNDVNVFLIARGYEPHLSQEDARRLAYVMAQASLEAYEGMAARQDGKVVKPPLENVLVSQYELQNATRSAAAYQEVQVTWQNLYDAWAKECVRPENTKSSYFAAMKLFISVCPLAPQAVTREGALKFRDFILHEQGRAPGTVANKIGFLGTLFNSGRNDTKYAKFLPHNPFENIKVKRSKRGRADKVRQPFSDADLKIIFGSPIYTEGTRPRGGGGEAAAWIPAIAYATGMRLEEIAVLKKSQFLEDATGIPYIHTEDGKNENSANRDVPIHQELIDAGLLEFVNSCSGRLFPEVKCSGEVESKAYSQWFGRYLEGLGIIAKSKVFHSFRHLFKDLCRNVNLDDSVVDQVCGHEPGTVGGRYGVGRRIDVLADLMAKVVFPVKLPRIMTNGVIG